MKSFSYNLLSMIELRGLTQTQLAELSGLSRPHIVILLNDPPENIRLSTIRRLAEALHCKASWLTRKSAIPETADLERCTIYL